MWLESNSQNWLHNFPRTLWLANCNFASHRACQCYIPSMYGVHFKGALNSGEPVCPGKVDTFSR